MIKAAISRGVLGLALATGLVGASAAQSPPQRIVSFNLCADQLVLALADPGQIIGLSPYAANPALSVVADKGARFPRLDWSAESVVSTAPDLVVTGPSDRPTQAMLAAMGMPIARVGLVSDLDAAMREAREVGIWVGHPERGEAMAQALARAAQRLAPSSAQRRTALVIERGGYAAGPQSLVAAMLAAAGLVPPPGAPSGYGGFVSLEQLLVMKPDLLVLKDAPDQAADQGALFLTHPALRALYPAARRINLPTRYTLCGGPALLEGLEYLAKTLER